MKLQHLILFSLILVITCMASGAFAQTTYWKQEIIPGLVGPHVFFLDSQHGITYGWDTWYTSNGSSWSRSTYPPGVAFYSIRLINGKLYAATQGPDILVSTDTGATWSFSGLGIANANDIYKDPSGVIQSAPVVVAPVYTLLPTTSVARADNFHLIATQDGLGATPHTAVLPLLSTDGGKTWNQTNIGAGDPCGFGAYGDTCGKVLMHCNDDGTVYRSVNLGATWNSVAGVGGLYDNLEGAAGVAYMWGGTRLIRSSDDGATWTNILIPNGPNDTLFDRHFAVWGPMGENIALLDDDTLWIGTHGGDGSLGFPSINDTVYSSSECNGAYISIPIQHVANLTSNVSIVKDSLKEFSIISFRPSGSSTDTLKLQYTPHTLPEISTLTLNFHATWRCSNWSEMRTIIVTSPPSALAVAPPSLAGSCELLSDTGFVSIDSCQSLVITNVTVAPLASRLQFQYSLPDTIHNGYHEILPFVFDPRDTNADGIVSVALHGFYLGTNAAFDTVLQIHLSAVPGLPQLSASISSVNFGAVNTCKGAADSIIFTNHGCGPDTITSITLSGTGFTVPNNPLPIIVQPDSSVTLDYHFLPHDSGSYSGTDTLYVNSMGLAEELAIALTGQGILGFGVLDVRSTSLQAGSFSFCDGDTMLTDTLRNSGCDTLVISNVRFGGDSAFALLSQPDSLLLPGASTIVQFYFAPRVKGAHSATLSFHLRNIVNDPGHDTTVTISGIGLGGKTALSTDTTPRNFGALYECEARDTTIWLRNPGCDTLRVDSASFSNASYSPDTTFPIFILPDSSVPVKIHLTGSANMDGSVTFYSNANTGSGTGTVPLQASPLHPATLRVVVEPSDSLAGGLTVTCYVMLEGQIPAGVISSLHFDVTHNDDLLSFLKASGAGLTLVNTSPKTGIVTQSFSLSPIPNQDTIGTLRFKVYLTDSTSTPIAISNVSFTTSLDLPPDCIASIVHTGAQFTYVYRCGEHALQNFMLNGQMPFSIESIVPNPATATLRVEGKGQRVEVELDDAIGRKALTPTRCPLPFTLDVSGLPSGTYFLRLSQNGYVQTREVSIEH